MVEKTPSCLLDMRETATGRASSTRSAYSDSRRLMIRDTPLSQASVRHGGFAGVVRFILAPLLLFSSGFFTADFLVSGVYTWPRSSRVLVLTLTVLILSYEFVYKEALLRHDPVNASSYRALKILFYACVVPYMAGTVILLLLLAFSS